MREPPIAWRSSIRNHDFRRNSEFISDYQRSGGADRDRTDDLKLAKLALSQLSYGPGGCCQIRLPIIPLARDRDAGGPGTS